MYSQKRQALMAQCSNLILQFFLQTLLKLMFSLVFNNCDVRETMLACTVLCLIHFSLDKVAAMSQTVFSDCIFVNEKLCILIKILLKFS